jgi:acyl carrier protein
MDEIQTDEHSARQASLTLPDWLAERVAYYLQCDPEQVEPNEPFADYGFDSVYALTLCGDIEERLGLAIEATVMWDYASVDALAGYLHNELGADWNMR